MSAWFVIFVFHPYSFIILCCSHAEFADDTTLWYSASDPLTLQAMLNADLETAEKGASKFRLQLGEKNKYLVFHAPRTKPFDLESIGGLSFFQRKLAPAESLLLLGLHFDPSLSLV